MNASREKLVAKHKEMMALGALIAVGSAVATALGFALASTFGGSFWFLGGGVLVGLGLFGRGYTLWQRAKAR
jgi:hypothetical protein